MARGGTLHQYIAERIAIEHRGHLTPCWIWQGEIRNGYGRGAHLMAGRFRVHRVTYQLFAGPIPEGMQIDHLCRVRSCCNPDHLEPVTNDENARRARGFNRRALCRRGHRLIGENRTEIIRNGKVREARCVACRRQYQRDYMRDYMRDYRARRTAGLSEG